MRTIMDFRLRGVFLSLFLLVVAKLYLIDGAVVDGQSMAPTIGAGRIVVILRAAYGLHNPGGRYLIRWSRPKPGDVVVVRNPATGMPVVKRIIAALPGMDVDDPSLFLMGDNPAMSVDSRSYGLVPVESVIGKVLLFPPWTAR